eukprot:8206981-Alexandrium_andersonii.AAC.1
MSADRRSSVPGCMYLRALMPHSPMNVRAMRLIWRGARSRAGYLSTVRQAVPIVAGMCDPLSHRLCARPSHD